jgi:hypothetical protein
MLYAGCANCQSVTTLVCTGQFMPHAAVAVEPTPMGPACAWCGLMPPVFTCFVCGTTQGVYFPGMTRPPAQGAGVAPLVAPVAQAPPNAAPHQLRSGFEQAAEQFASSFGKQLGQNLANSMSSAWS